MNQYIILVAFQINGDWMNCIINHFQIQRQTAKREKIFVRSIWQTKGDTKKTYMNQWEKKYCSGKWIRGPIKKVTKEKNAFMSLICKGKYTMHHRGIMLYQQGFLLIKLPIKYIFILSWWGNGHTLLLRVHINRIFLEGHLEMCIKRFHLVHPHWSRNSSCQNLSNRNNREHTQRFSYKDSNCLLVCNAKLLRITVVQIIGNRFIHPIKYFLALTMILGNNLKGRR